MVLATVWAQNERAHVPTIASEPQFGKGRRCETCAARGISVCGAMREQDLGRLSGARTTQQIEAGETFLNEGDAATHFLNIVDGAVKVYKLMPDGRRQITGFLFAGDLLGLAVNDSYTYSAEAMTSVAVCRFPRKQLERLLDDFPKMEKRLLAMASNELAAAQEQMMLLGRKTAHERIASFLLMMARRQERFGRSGTEVELSMTRTDIADYLGLTTETSSRVFTSLKKRGWIELSSGKVTLSDRDMLEELAAGLE
jgi:CRP/FNR family transcriptional regulator, anaerobic regulatory protein